MAYNFVATDAFERDYDSALAYIAYELGAPKAASRMVDMMQRSVDKITEDPFLNVVSTKPTLEALEYREEFVGSYVMLYKVEGDDIVAKRLFHMSQDYESYV